MSYNFSINNGAGGDLSYQFTTDTQNEIVVSFANYGDLFENSPIPVYSLDIARQIKNDQRCHRNDTSGEKTRDTIIEIIELFFRDYNGALVAVMENTTDEKSEARKELFQRWFNQYGTEDYELETRTVDFGFDNSENGDGKNRKTYSMLILRKNCGYEKILKEEFDNFINLINS